MSGTDYFTFSQLVAGTTARASDVNARMQAIQTAFGLLPVPLKLQQGRATYVHDLGTTDNLVVTLDFSPADYIEGMELTLKVGNSNLGQATLNVNGLGAKTIVRANGSTIQAGDLTTGQICKMVYDGTNFRVLNASETAITVIAASAASAAANASASEVNAAASATAAAASATAASGSATAAAASAASAATAVTGYLPKAGGTMTGSLILFGAPTTNLEAATKKYVDDAVFAAGAYTADGASITLSAGQFSLTTIANNRLFGNVSGGTAKPGALTGTQATALLDPFTTTLKGLVAAPGSLTGKVLKDDGTWTTDITGNSATATKLATARTIAISGAVTGTATGFDGSGNITIPISALNVGLATSGILATARGGTGVSTSTGSGNNVLSDSPAFTGNAQFQTIIASQNIYGIDIVASRGDGTGVIFLNGAQSRWLYYNGTDYTFQVAKVSATAPPAGASDSYLVNSAWVRGELAGYSPARIAIQSAAADYTIVDAHNNQLHLLTGAHTITAGAGPAVGTSVLFKNIGTAWTFSCAAGVYLDGSATTVTSATIAAGASCTGIHLGSGQWLLSGA